MTKESIYVTGIKSGSKLSSPQNITYSFWSDSTLDDEYEGYDKKDTIWSKDKIENLKEALKAWEAVANIKFSETEENNEDATLKFSLLDNEESNGWLGYFDFPSETSSGIGYFNHESLWKEEQTSQGSYTSLVLLHEIGHALGLAHPHDDGDGHSDIYPGVEHDHDLGEHDLNQGIWTTMSYITGAQSNGLKSGQSYGYQGTPMSFDIAAIQGLYGANNNHNSGNTVYTLPTENDVGTFYQSIWDTGGFDTISAEDSNLDVTINLNAASLQGANAGGYVSSAQGIYGGFTIAHDVVIEKAIGGSGNDTIIGNSSNNNLHGGAGNDWLKGGDGDDWLYGGQGADFIDGGQGKDRVNYRRSNAGITIDLSQNIAFGGDASGDSLHSIEGVYASDFRDILTGDQNKNTLIGYGGNDHLSGRGGNDILNGGDGNDWLEGGVGADKIYGGIGRDTVSYLSSTAAVEIDLTIGTTKGGDATGDILKDIENIQGSNFSDSLTGTWARNSLTGNTGNDVLNGAGGHDQLDGGDDNDTLIGGQGNDTLTGGSGADIFTFNSPLDGVDTITDFKYWEGDRVHISATGFGITSHQINSFSFSGNSLFFEEIRLANIPVNHVDDFIPHYDISIV